jgi:ubiquitin-like 1-activating enzyme E1 B
MTDEEKDQLSSFILKLKTIKLEDFDSQASQLTPGCVSSSHLSSLRPLAIVDCVHLFARVVKQIEVERKAQIGCLSFDKDDELAMDFVTAATNIRAFNFAIDAETPFKIKEMAGKIVPAISSSNAMVANLQVIEAIKLLAGRVDQLRGVAYNRTDKKERFSWRKRAGEGTNPNCKVCSDDSLTICIVSIPDFETASLEFLLTILHEKLSLKTSNLFIEFDGKIIFERYPDNSDEDEVSLNEKRLQKSLQSLRLKSMCILFL